MAVPATPAAAAAAAAPVDPAVVLPERAAVIWRPRVTERVLRRQELAWTLTSLAHSMPFVIAGALLGAVKPVLIPISLMLFAHAWAIPEMYANRGAKVMRARSRAGAGPEARAALLLADLVGHDARELHAETGLITERGALGVWILGEAGALLVRTGGPGRRRAPARFTRIDCYCVTATGDDLPAGDRIAHLLLALRVDESEFATIANLAFSGAAWRVLRRLPAEQRAAVRAAREDARRGD